MDERIGRRAFLAVSGTAAVAGAFAIGRVTAGSGPSVDDASTTTQAPNPAVAAVRRLFLETEGPRRIGSAYLTADPDTPASADGYLPAGFVPVESSMAAAWLSSAERQDLAAPASHLARSDFSEGRVVEVGGWRLARSTAELCAVLARSA